jgi:hypothetical protein
MADPQTAFVFGVETECLTAVPDEPDRVGEAITRFLDVLARQTPVLLRLRSHRNRRDRV